MTLRTRRNGFTLIELLVVIAIIATLIALLVPAVQKVRAAAMRTQCSNNMKQMALGLHNYHSEFNKFPPGGDLLYCASWMVYILPYVEQLAIYENLWPLFKSGIYDYDGVSLPNAVDSGLPISTFACPADPRGQVVDAGDCLSGNLLGGSRPVFMTGYVGIAGIDVGSSVETCSQMGGTAPFPPPSSQLGIFNNTTAANFSQTEGYPADFPTPTNPGLAGNCVTISQIMDGTSNTLMIGERPFITPPSGGTFSSFSAGGNFSLSWTTFANYWDGCLPSYAPPMGYYIYSGNLTRDTINGVANVTQTIATDASGANNPCSAGPFYFGQGPNDVNNACSFNYIWSTHVGGGNFAMADGSIRFVAIGISHATISAASTYAGGETIGSDW